MGRLSVLQPAALGTPVEGGEWGIVCGTAVETAEGLIGVVPSAPAPEDTWASGHAAEAPSRPVASPFQAPWVGIGSVLEDREHQ